MRSLRILSILALLLVLWTQTALAQTEPPSEPISFDSYWQLVTDSRQALRKLRGQPKDAILPPLAELAGRWEAVKTLQMPNGEVITVDTGPIVNALTVTEPDIVGIELMFETLEKGRNGYRVRRPPLQAEEKLKAILSRPEFQYAEVGPNPLDEFWARFWEWIEELLGWGDGAVAQVSFPVLQVVSIVLLVAALFFIFRSLYLASMADVRAEDDPEGDETLTAETAFKKAQSLSGAGDNRTAVRYLYLSSLLLLDERGLLRYDRTKTNREYLRGIADRPALVGPLRDVIEVFDRVWYGFKPLDNETFEQYVERVKELREQKHE